MQSERSPGTRPARSGNRQTGARAAWRCKRNDVPVAVGGGHVEERERCVFIAVSHSARFFARPMRQNCSKSRRRNRGRPRAWQSAPHGARRRLDRVRCGGIGDRHLADLCRSLRGPDRVGACLERLDLAIEDVAAVLEHEAVEVRLGRVVRRLRPADVVRRSTGAGPGTRPTRTVRGDAWRAQLHLEIRCGYRPTAGASCSTAGAFPEAERDGAMAHSLDPCTSLS